MGERPDPQPDAVEHLEALRHVEGRDGHKARSKPALGDKRCAGIGGELPHTPRACHILCQVEIVRTGRSSRFRDERRQMEGGGIEHGKLPVQQLDQL